MIRSMTAFARRETEASWGSAVFELRAVNHRYLDAVVRLPEELRGLEPTLRERLGKSLKRGKVEINLRYKPGAGANGELNLNETLAGRLAEACSRMEGMLENPGRVSPLDILRWPGVLESESPDMDAVKSAVLALFDQALKELVETRQREGASTHTMLTARCDEAGPIIEAVRTRLPQVIQAQRERLGARVAELQEGLAPERLEQELVLIAQKLDVAEELDRLQTHITEVRRVLEQDKPVGRRLDFLMQELNREANTLGSKSADSQTTQASVDLKVLIEQMREQVQNVE